MTVNPTIPQGFSPNEDGYNDWFNIDGLYDIYLQHELLIFNRFGTLIFKGDNDLKWDGKANYGPLKETTFFLLEPIFMCCI